MTYDDADMQTVSDLTDEWIRCVAAKNTARVAELLTEDFVYSRHPKWGDAVMSKAAIIEFMPSIEESEAKVVDQRMYRFGDVVLVHNVTQADQKVSEARSDAGSFLGKMLLDSSAWRKEDGQWRCFDYRLIDALDG